MDEWDLAHPLWKAYGDLVLFHGQHLNLTAWKDLEEWLEKGIKPSLRYARQVPVGASVLDIGSGQGLPGIVIAASCPHASVMLLEPRAARAAFLRHALHRLGLKAEVSQQAAQQHRGRYDVITARAVAPEPTIRRWAKHLAHPKTLWLFP